MRAVQHRFCDHPSKGIVGILYCMPFCGKGIQPVIFIVGIARYPAYAVYGLFQSRQVILGIISIFHRVGIIRSLFGVLGYAVKEIIVIGGGNTAAGIGFCPKKKGDGKAAPFGLL